MNQARKQRVSETVQNVFAENNLDYDNFSRQIVPLNQMMAEYPLMVAELPNGKTLSTKTAVKFLEIEIGFEMPDLKTDERKLSGFLYTAKFGEHLQGCIFTDKSEPTARRRFSAAHEFGHYLLHFLQLLEITDAENLFLTESLAFGAEAENEAEIEMAQDFDFKKLGVADKKQMEAEADFFAAELLMPRNACRQANEFLKGFAGKNKRAVINYFATEFLVSFEAMKRRLEDLKMFEKEA
ncbi:MAG: ImmA/IrrE family metallo-endopeptidase [Pyrinomonadaceae bacterium]|nr:ImmA/IrrE family metallo-endopeptidase [Pyrinomonadaceae bacterium]